MSALRGILILLVEDNLDVRDLTAFLLEGRGARVLVAVNGADAFVKLLGNVPDLVLCDLMIPVMDGIESLKGSVGLPSAPTSGLSL
jgi:CheY-like chemotaxis protein